MVERKLKNNDMRKINLPFSPECQPPMFLCNDGKTCISDDKICDGQVDCPVNFDDELQNCTGKVGVGVGVGGVYV